MQGDTTDAKRLEAAVRLAREAGDITLEYYRREDLEVERKGDDSPVTIADRRAEEHLRAGIAAAFPDDAILGEEFPDQPGTSGFRWILDPIDGTKSFIHGVPLYGTLVGVEQDGECRIGVIHIPVLDECAYASTGLGAWYLRGGSEPRPARVSACRTLADAVFLTSEVRSFDEHGRREMYDRLQSVARLSRTWGDCYGYLLVATGRAEVMVDPIMAIWDAAALKPILEEAGGTFTDFEGRPTIHSNEGVATNAHLLEEVLAITHGA